MTDQQLMRMALRLARRGEGRVSPNPMVGAVVARDGRVVGTGYHVRFGGPHAELVALQEAGERARGADLYVNLEPCCHHGKQPPCVEAIVAARVRRVVVGSIDRNPQVSGKGIEALRQAGIQVDVGLLGRECERLNAPFFKWVTSGLPHVTLKLAATLDGYLADRYGESRWISCESSRRLVHRHRGVSDAVMVGAGTAAMDDPLLLPTLVRPRRVPLRVVADEACGLSVDSRLVRSLDQGPVLLFTTKAAHPHQVEAIRRAGVEVVETASDDGLVALRELLRELGRRQVVNLLVEGGSRLAASFLAQGLVDRFELFVASKVLGDRQAVPMFADLGIHTLADARLMRLDKVKKIGDDVLLSLVPIEGGACSQG